jgi:hypothetical protein
MAIIQLIYLTAGEDKSISDFWHFDLNRPTAINHRSTNLTALKKLCGDQGIGSSYANEIQTQSWPQSTSVIGIPAFEFPMAFCLAIAWNALQVANKDHQPLCRYWIIQPAKEKILNMFEKRQEALACYRDLMFGRLEDL